MSQDPRRRFAIALVFALLVGLFTMLLAAPAARAGAAIVFSDGFEGGSLAAAWTSNDTNALSGLDYWAPSTFRPHSGNFSAWCAQVGNQSIGGQNNSAVHEYDDNMQADLSIDLHVNGFSSLTLSFWYWVRTENGGGDWLQAIYEAGGVQTLIFQQGGSSGNAWQPANLSVPNNLDRLIFRFHSDTANHGFEGAYVDDIVLLGIENVAPTSRVSSLPVYSNLAATPIPFTAADNSNASGVAFVELFYRLGSAGPYRMYNTSMNRLGHYALSPIVFDVGAALGDGRYEFYTVAVDNAGNVEPAPSVPDANTTIDTTPPTLAINDPFPGALLNASTATVAWQSLDALSGLDHYETSLDGAAFQGNGVAGTASFLNLAEGSHSVRVRAFDRAGNVAEASVSFTVDTEAPVVLISSPGSGDFLHTVDATFTWTSFDNTSGIDHYAVWLDDGAPIVLPTTNVRYTVPGIPDGAHTFHVSAVDKAGNTATAVVAFTVDRNPFSLTGPYGALPLVLLLMIILALMFFLLLWWRRRKEDEVQPPEKLGPAAEDASAERSADTAAVAERPTPDTQTGTASTNPKEP